MEGWGRILLAAVLAGALAGCAVSPAPAPVPTVSLQPYATATEPPPGSPGATVAPLPTAGPSPTPRTYTVRSGDQFLSIALAFGLTRDELLAANPGINADLLSIGQQLLIPAPGGQGTATPIPTATPLSLGVSEPRCFPGATGGLWCLVTVTNTTEESVEGLSGLLTLVDRAGKPLLTVPIYPPLNVVQPGRAMVLAAFLPPPVIEYDSAAAVLTMAVHVQQAEARYAALDWNVTRSEPGTDRRSWSVEVEAKVPEDSARVWRVAFAVLAFDERGEVIGYAKWEDDAATRPGERSEAMLTVFSLGPAIERIDVLAEAMPAP